MIDEVEYEENVERAIARVIEAFSFSQQCRLGDLYVAFSGGKDSVALYGIVEEATDRLDMRKYGGIARYHYNLTTVDPPEVVRFIKDEYPMVMVHRPKLTMWQLIIKKGTPPSRQRRYCCKEMKENGGDMKFCLTGVRWAESTKRKSRGVYEDIGATQKEGRILFSDNSEDRRLMEHCIPKRKYVCNPLLDWSDEMVWEYIRRRGLKYCSLYDEGFTRIGCIGCPLASIKHREKQFERWPKYKDQYIRTFQRMIDARIEKGKYCTWKTGQEVFDWWMED